MVIPRKYRFLPCNLRQAVSPSGRRPLSAQFGDPVGESRNFALSGAAMHDAPLRRANDRGLGFRHRRQRAGAIAGRDRLLDLAHRRAQARTPRLVDHGTTCDLTSGLLGGFRIGHE